MSKHTTDSGDVAIVLHPTNDNPPENGGQTAETPQFYTIDHLISANDGLALGMMIHGVLAICYTHKACIRHGYGSPKAGNPRKYWLEIGGQTHGQYSGGKSIGKFRAHSTEEAVQKATRLLVKAVSNG